MQYVGNTDGFCALIVAILSTGLELNAEEAFNQYYSCNGKKIRYSMPLQEVLDSVYLQEHDGWSLQDLSEATGFSRFKLCRNTRRYKLSRPLE